MVVSQREGHEIDVIVWLEPKWVAGSQHEKLAFKVRRSIYAYVCSNGAVGSVYVKGEVGDVQVYSDHGHC